MIYGYRIVVSLVLISFGLAISTPAMAQSKLLGPKDFAIAGRDAPIYENLEPYAEILAYTEAGQYYPLIELKIDKYGIKWVLVEVEDGIKGYFSDAILLRKNRSDLKKIIAKADFQEIRTWDEKTNDQIEKGIIEVGFTETQLLFALGLPRAERELGDLRELTFSRSRILLKNGSTFVVSAIEKLPLDIHVNSIFTVEDDEVTASNGRWEITSVGTAKYLIDREGSGRLRYRLRLPATGKYQFISTWLADSGNSMKVFYRIVNGKHELGYFIANQRLYSGKKIILGEASIASDRVLVIEVKAQDALPFGAGILQVVFIND